MRTEGFDYETHSRLAGPFADADPCAYRVAYRSLLSREELRTRIRAVVLMTLAPLAAAGLLLYLVWPAHRTVREGGERWLVRCDAVMLGSIALIMLFTLVNVVSIAHATMVARDPVPVPAQPGTRVAFLTTYVPGKEPLAMVAATLRGAVAIRHAGPLDVWLLDEGDDPGARALCAALGARHFTRKGRPEWNTKKGAHRARTKHGNYNAWLARNGDDYDYFASVDTDHVPLPNYLERMLGFFRDPDVAFVVGPQVYGNYQASVTKAAESQQYLFHALIQRAGNRYGAPMFVGTNNAGLTTQAAQYTVAGLTRGDARNVYGLAERLSADKQDFQGIKSAYEFDPKAEKYVPVDPMRDARWYPTLVGLADGRVLAVSGLNDVGDVVPGHNEYYDPRTRKWTKGPFRYFPTYPSLFLTQGGKLFYTGSNAGYGPKDKGREPGVWDLATSGFRKVGGLADPDQLETSSSVLLAPAQDQKVMVLGGGGVGESKLATARTAVVDLKEDNPVFRSTARLPKGVRYLSTVLLPDDSVFTTGGSADYRGRGASDIHKAQFYYPRTDSFVAAADPTVGRNYHSEALLLPDGRVATFGSDPLFADKDNTRLGKFEHRLEVYSPPYLYRDAALRPALGDGPEEVAPGGRATFPAPRAERIARARLMRPSAVTHSTDVEQRSVALGLEKTAGAVTVTVPADPTLVPPGWYMLFVTDADGTPSVAKWLRVREEPPPAPATSTAPSSDGWLD